MAEAQKKQNQMLKQSQLSFITLQPRSQTPSGFRALSRRSNMASVNSMLSENNLRVRPKVFPWTPQK